MKHIITVAVLVLVLVPGAFAAGVAKDPRVPALQRAVAAQNRNIANLQAEVAELTAMDTRLAAGIVVLTDKGTCTTAITWDAIVLLANYVLGSSLGRLDDGGACARLGISRGTAAFHAVSSPATQLRLLSAQLEK